MAPPARKNRTRRCVNIKTEISGNEESEEQIPAKSMEELITEVVAKKRKTGDGNEEKSKLSKTGRKLSIESTSSSNEHSEMSLNDNLMQLQGENWTKKKTKTELRTERRRRTTETIRRENETNFEVPPLDDKFYGTSERSRAGTSSQHLEHAVEENDEFDSDDTVAKDQEKRAPSSSSNKWIPSNLIETTCFDKTSGILLSKQACEANLERAFKSKKVIDFYDILKYSDDKVGRSTAFCIYLLDKIQKKPAKENFTEKIEPGAMFSLESAKSVDSEQQLPGGKRVKLSSLISSSSTSSWKSKNSFSTAVCSVLNQIAIRDKWFFIYSSPETEKAATHYVALDGRFIEHFAFVMRAGFNMGNDETSIGSTVTTVKSAIRNFIDNGRKEVKGRMESLEDLLAEFKAQEQDFRSSEMPLHMEEPLQYIRNIKRKLAPPKASNKSTPNF